MTPEDSVGEDRSLHVFRNEPHTGRIWSSRARSRVGRCRCHHTGSPWLWEQPEAPRKARSEYDGHLDRDWSCGSLRAAYKRLPKDGVSSTLPVVIAHAVAEACDAALKSVHVRMTTASVRVALGSPDKAGRCWRFTWPAADAGQSVLDDPSKRRSAVDGARACFNDGRVSLLQTAVHG
jgi:hypothetical protein